LGRTGGKKKRKIEYGVNHERLTLCEGGKGVCAEFWYMKKGKDSTDKLSTGRGREKGEKSEVTGGGRGVAVL